ncbi:MAG: Rpn family recombination-promoting nuclease/putative transposase [Bacteroidota bacterium]
MKFVDVKNDVAFRKIFGDEQKTVILISFLNAVLHLENQDRIKEVAIINPFQLPRVAGEKASIIDLRAKDQAGRQFVIEMQVADVDGFEKRVQYYTCRDYSMQINRGDQYALLQPTYFIGILDFNFFDSPHYLSNHIIVNGETFEHKLTDIQFTFIELKKFSKEVHELDSLVDKWIFFLKAADSLEVIPENIDDEGLLEAFKNAEKFRWDKEELIAYDNFFIAEQDKRGRVIAAERKAKQEGKQEVVLRSYKAGLDLTVIAQITDLSIEEVEQIIRSSK